MPTFQHDKPVVPETTVDHILAFETTELVEYIKPYCLVDGGFELGNADGWDDLSETRRAELTEELK